jgi:lysophospholipase L1-like esterase
MSSKNQIDVSRYVAFGDSITAGYADGALYCEGQKNSYADILAQQFKLVGGGDFRQALMDKNSVGVDQMGHSRLILKTNLKHSNDFILSYQTAKGDVEALSHNVYAKQGPFNNIGVPGAKLITSVVSGYGNSEHGAGNYNPFFTRLASNPAKASMLSDALQHNPTFFSLFIGNNDCLAYALSGGTTDTISPLDGFVGKGFEQSFHYLVNALTEKKAKGVIANLPDIHHIPYFNAIPYNGLMLDMNAATVLNKKYHDVGIHFYEGANPFLIEDPTANASGMRLLEKGELVLLDVLLEEDKSNYLQAKQPIPRKYILNLADVLKIHTAINQYNQVIKSITQEKKLAFVDIHSLIKIAKPDRFYNSVSLNLEYKKRGIFSLDGLHPNFFGQAIIANQFIKAINITYQSKIPLVNILRYKGIQFPE